MIDIGYKSITSINGPLIIVSGVEDVGFNELVKLELEDETRLGQVIEVSGKNAVIQILQGTSGIAMGRSHVKFTGDTLKIRVSDEIVGRTLNGLGRAIDGGPEPTGEKLDINGAPINPYMRVPPKDFIQTGISIIDGLMSLIRGQKLPIFSGYGLPHNILTSQVIRQSKLLRKQESFAVIFAALGISNEDADFFRRELQRSEIYKRTVFVLNLQSDSTIERIVAPRVALTIAEHLALERDYHVLVIMSNLTNYCEALREVSLARGEIPGRRGYPGYMYSDLATLYERAGLLQAKKGSITQMPVLSMPDDDITHPIPDLTGYITEGQIVMSRGQHVAGIYPPIDVLSSLSRLMKDGIGEGYTRRDHFDIYRGLFAAYAEGSRSKEIAAILGEETLTPSERNYIKFAEAFERTFMNQGKNEERDIEKTLDIGQQVLSIIK